jgi:hypothetical protein
MPSGDEPIDSKKGKGSRPFPFLFLSGACDLLVFVISTEGTCALGVEILDAADRIEASGGIFLADARNDKIGTDL